MNTQQNTTLELSDTQLETISGGCYRSSNDSCQSSDSDYGDSDYGCDSGYDKDDCGSYDDDQYGCHKPRRFHHRHHCSSSR